MAISKRGIKRIILTSSGQMDEEDPTGLVTTGTRKPGQLVISPLDTLKDHKQRELRNLMNFKSEISSFQGRMRFFEQLIGFISNGFDIQVAMQPQSSGADGGVFNFLTQIAGLDFEIFYGGKERFLSIIHETAMEYEAAVTAIDLADSYGSLLPSIAANAISGGNEEGANLNLYAHPYYGSIEAPASIEIFSKKEIDEREFRIKTVGYKNAYNETVQPNLLIELNLTGSDARISKLIELLNKDMGASLVVKEYIAGTTYYEKYSIAANLLTHKEEFGLGDDKRQAKIMISGEVSPSNFSFAYGSSNGGAGTGSTESEKLAGGTCTIA